MTSRVFILKFLRERERENINILRTTRLYKKVLVLLIMVVWFEKPEKKTTFLINISWWTVRNRLSLCYRLLKGLTLNIACSSVS